MDNHTFEYDIAVTFAGEHRDFVEAVVRDVKAAGFTVFYDQDEQAALWGEELTEHFPTVYEQRARFAVMFVSRNYASKPWTRLERRSVLLRALQQPTPYVLPVRLDNTSLPGLRDSISYLDGRTAGPTGIASAIKQKLGADRAAGGTQFNGYVPRNEHEATILIGERPSAWEYLLYSYSLVTAIEELHDRYLDHQMRFALTRHFVADGDVTDQVARDHAYVISNIRNFNSVLNPEMHEMAFGKPGESGEIGRILHLAKRYTQVYEEFLDWAARLRGYATESDEAHELFAALAQFNDQPVERLRSFVYEFREQLDSMTVAIGKGEPFELTLVITLEVPDEVIENFNRALQSFSSRL